MTVEWIGDAWGWFTTSRIQTISAVSAASVGIATLRRAQRSSKSQARPMVGAELRIVPYTTGVLQLVVKNYSDTVARNVKVKFEPTLGGESGGDADMRTYIDKRYSAVIATMMPGAEFTNSYATIGRDEETNPPAKVKVTITCESADTSAVGRSDKFVDTFTLDTELFENHTFATSSTSPQGQMNKLIDAVKMLGTSK